MPEKNVRLSVPAELAFARTVRMMASNLAVVSGMGVEDVDEVRMAAEEGFVYACATTPACCEVAFSLSERRVEMSFSLGDAPSPDAGDGPVPDALRYADLLLSAVCDEYEVDRARGVLRLAKAAGGEHDE